MDSSTSFSCPIQRIKLHDDLGLRHSALYYFLEQETETRDTSYE